MLLRATVGAGRRVRVPAQVAGRRAPRLQLAWERLASTKWSLGISASANCVERERESERTGTAIATTTTLSLGEGAATCQRSALKLAFAEEAWESEVWPRFVVFTV